MMIRRNTLTVTAAAAALAFGLTACGGDMGGEEEAAEETPTATDTESSGMSGEGGEEGMSGAAAETFGAGCAEVPEDGEGSFEGMADDPVATAATNNPVLETLVTAVTEAELVDTLNSAEDITVFAPANAAFEEIPQEDLDALLADKEQLTEVLTYHVVEGRHTPSDLENGTFTSLQGGEVTTEGSGEDFTVNGEAGVICGNVQTANATVYIIDGVLMPA